LESYPEFRECKGRIEIEGVLPTLMSNEAGLTLCISELLRNGLKFVAPGVTPHLRVRAETMEAPPERLESGTNPPQSGQRGRFRLWFEDNGIGIPRGYRERVFQMFQRLDKRYDGTGIGLAVVKKCCERMAAKIRLESEPGQGSKFGIEFPTDEYLMSGKGGGR
jgi:signal transduction histidine kinase